MGEDMGRDIEPYVRVSLINYSALKLTVIFVSLPLRRPPPTMSGGRIISFGGRSRGGRGSAWWRLETAEARNTGSWNTEGWSGNGQWQQSGAATDSNNASTAVADSNVEGPAAGHEAPVQRNVTTPAEETASTVNRHGTQPSPEQVTAVADGGVLGHQTAVAGGGASFYEAPTIFVEGTFAHWGRPTTTRHTMQR